MLRVVPHRKTIIIGSSVAVIIAICGYSIIQKSIKSQVVLEGGSTLQGYNTATNSGDQQAAKEMQVDKSKDIVVHIIGRVKKPGIVKIKEGGRIADAIKAAGGLLEDADIEVVNLAYRLQDGKQVYIPSKNENLSAHYNGGQSTKTSNASKGKAPELKARKTVPGVQADTAPPSKIATDSAGVVSDMNDGVDHDQHSVKTVNINTAGLKELDDLPGVGPATAQKIIDYRNKNGNFKKPEDLMKVNGIGPSKFEKVKDRIVI